MSVRQERREREKVRENDPWSVLGLRPGATPEEIRKAFRRRIKKVHPDSRTADSIHIQSVCSLVQAYRFLEKRFVPEVIGTASDEAGHETLLEEAGDGLFLFLDVTAEDAFRGNSVKVSISDVEAVCPACSGKGDVPITNFHECTHCSGTGFHELPWGKNRLRVVCNTCKGKGAITERKCNLCRGSGRITRQRSVDVRLPPGIRDGSIIKLPAQGQWKQDRQCRNDLFVEIRVKYPPGWKLQGMDVVSSVEVDLWTALAGGSVIVETLEGPEAISLEPCSFDKAPVTLTGKGWIDRDGRRGDHIVSFRVVLPKGSPPPGALALLRWLRYLWPVGRSGHIDALPPP